MPSGTEASDPMLAAARRAAQVAERLRDVIASELSGEISLEAWLGFLASLGELNFELHAAGAEISMALGVRSAKDRLRAYLLANVGEVVNNKQLAGVAGAMEWARRVRELAVEEGWVITRGPQDGLLSGEYRLESTSIDALAAERWRERNESRRASGSATNRLLEYLRKIHPRTASKEDLAYVARIQEWPRRMRELAEAGWSIVSSNDDPTLPAGSYRLETLTQGPPRARKAIAQRHQILERDRWTCRSCGNSLRDQPGLRLQIHHRHQVQHGGTNDDDNLITLCTACHAGVHSSSETRDELLEPAHDPWMAGPPPGEVEDTSS